MEPAFGSKARLTLHGLSDSVPAAKQLTHSNGRASLRRNATAPNGTETAFMIERHVVFYVGSKALAAVLNLASVALFTRLAGPAGYGEYLIAFAWAYIVYGWSTQWLSLSFFAHYEPDASSRLVATLYRMLAVLLAVVGTIALVVCLLGFTGWSLTVKVLGLVLGLSVYDAAIQVGRAKLRAGRVSLAIVLRGVLVLTFGAVALSVFKSGVALTLAVALAHLLSILPMLPVLRAGPEATGSRSTAWLYAQYGWPLMASFGTSSLGQNIDRLVLARQRSVASVGPYGAVSDLIRQSLVFISEAIAIAYIPLAKAAFASNDIPAAQRYLVQAFRAYSAVFLFGSVVLLNFADKLVATILGPDFAAATAPLLPWFALAAGLTIFRSYYLGQVIYFTGSSRLELAASIATVCVTASLAFLLVPGHGAIGAAIAMASGQAAACVVFLVSALSRPDSPMPLPWRDFLLIGIWAAGGYAMALAIDNTFDDTAMSDILEGVVIGLTMWGAARTYNIMNFNDIVSDFNSLAGRVGLIGDGDPGPAPPGGRSGGRDGQ